MTTLLRAIAFLVLGTTLQGCFLFCALSPGGCDAPKTEQQLVAPGVQVSLASSRVPLLPGGSGVTTVSLVLTGGLTGSTLAVGTLPVGVTASFNPPTVTGSGSSVLTLTASSSAIPGLFLFDVVATGTGGNPQATGTASVTGEVLQPFRLQGGNGASIGVGATQDLTVAVDRVAGFTEPVAFSVDPATLPAGATTSFTPAVATGSTSTLRVTVPSTAPTGRYLTRVIATYGASRDSALHPINITAVLPPADFSITGTPSTITVVPGATADYALTLTRTAPGIGNIALTASGLPAGAAATFVPSSASGTTAQLAVATSASTPPGSYPVTITGTAGALVRQGSVTLVVDPAPDFTLSATPASLTVARGATGQSAIAIQRTGNPGTIALDVTGLPSGVTATANPSSAAGTSSVLSIAVGASVAPGTYPLVVRGVAGTLTRTTPLTLTVPAPPSGSVAITLGTTTVTVPAGGVVQVPVRLTRTGTAIGQLIELRTAGGHAWVAPNFVTGDTATLHVVGTATGASTIVVSAAVGAIPPSATLAVTTVTPTAPDFALVPASPDFTLNRGIFTPFALDIRRLAGFTGAVTLTAVTDQPGAWAVNFTPATVTGTSAQVDVYASDLVPVGRHLLILRGTSNGVTRSVFMTLNVR